MEKGRAANGVIVVAVLALVVGVAWYNATDAQVLTAASGVPRVVDLGSTSCKACKDLAPILEELKREYAGRVVVEFIDAFKDQNAAKPYDIRLIPTQIFYDRDGKEVWRNEGFLPKEEFVKKFAELGVAGDPAGSRSSTAAASLSFLERLAARLADVIKANVWLAPLAALLGGLLTAANPCVLAAAPLMIGYVAGQEVRTLRRSLFLSLTFTLGLTITFILLWFGVRAASLALPEGWWKYVAVTVCLLMGLHLVGLLDLRIPAPSGWQPQRRGYLGALLLGLLFGLISLPCVGPVLGVLLAMSAAADLLFGLLLLVAYSLGHCGLVLVGGTSVVFVQRLVDSKGLTRGTDMLRRAAGVLIAGVGLWLLFFA